MGWGLVFVVFVTTLHDNSKDGFVGDDTCAWGCSGAPIVKRRTVSGAGEALHLPDIVDMDHNFSTSASFFEKKKKQKGKKIDLQHIATMHIRLKKSHH